MRSILVIFIISVAFSFGVAQDAENRYEFWLDGENGVGDLYVLNSHIVLTSYADFSKHESHPDRTYSLLDSTLMLVQEESPIIPFRHKHVDSYVSDSVLYDLYYDYRFGDFTLIRFSDNQQFSQITGTLPSRMYEPKLVANDSFMWVVNQNPKVETVVVYNMKDSTVKKLDVSPRLKRSKARILTFSQLGINGDVVYAWQEQNRKQARSYVATWTEDGILSTPYKVEHDEDLHVVSLEIGANADGDHVLAGTYGKPFSVESTGVYFAIVQDGSVVKFKPTPFTELHHFFDYLTSYQKENFERKLKRLKRHEKNTDISTLCLVHPIYYSDSSYFVGLEMYNRSLVDEYGVTRNGNAVVGSPQRLEGYHFTHASVIRYNVFGDLQHDYYLPLKLRDDPRALGLNLRMQPQADSLVVAYASKNSVYAGKFRPQSFFEMKKDTSLGVKADSIQWHQRQIRFWKDEAFLLYGFETRVSKSPLKRNEKLFYIEKRKLR